MQVDPLAAIRALTGCRVNSRATRMEPRKWGSVTSDWWRKEIADHSSLRKSPSLRPRSRTMGGRLPQEELGA